MSGIGTPGDFPGPLFTAIPPVEMDWPMRRTLYDDADGRRRRRLRPDDRQRRSRRTTAAPFESLMYGHVGEQLADRFGTKGAPISLTTACASGATAIQLGVEAIRRGETDAALCVGTDCSVHGGGGHPLLPALGALQRQRGAGGGGAALLQGPRRLRHRRGRGGAGPRGLRRGTGARREDPRRHPRRRREGRRFPPHPLEAGRLGGHRRAPQHVRRRRARRPARSTTSTPTAPARRRTTRWRRCRSRRCSASGCAACRSARTSR